MGWMDVLDIGPGVANLAANASHAGTLQQMRAQGATAVRIQGVIKELRGELIHFRQTAETILVAEATAPRKVTAGAMRLVELRLDASGITPDLFQTLGDKEYAAAASRMIRDNGHRLLQKLMPEEQVQLNEAIPAAFRLPDYDFYVASYGDVQAFRRALLVFRELKVWQLNPLVLIFVVWLSFSAFVLGGTWTISLILGDEAGLFGFVASSAAWIAAFWLYLVKLRRGKDFQQAKKVVEQVQRKVNLDRFSRLEHEFGADEATVVDLQGQAWALTRKFFGEQ
jgi:hypothetical protein